MLQANERIAPVATSIACRYPHIGIGLNYQEHVPSLFAPRPDRDFQRCLACSIRRLAPAWVARRFLLRKTEARAGNVDVRICPGNAVTACGSGLPPQALRGAGYSNKAVAPASSCAGARLVAVGKLGRDIHR